MHTKTTALTCAFALITSFAFAQDIGADMQQKITLWTANRTKAESSYRLSTAKLASMQKDYAWTIHNIDHCRGTVGGWLALTDLAQKVSDSRDKLESSYELIQSAESKARASTVKKDAALDALSVEYGSKAKDDTYLAKQEAIWADIESDYSIPMTTLNQQYKNYLKAVSQQIAVQRKFQNCPHLALKESATTIGKALNPVNMISETIKAAIPKP